MSEEPNSDDAKKDSRISDKAIEYIQIQMKQSEDRKKADEFISTQISSDDLNPSEVDKLRKENEQLVKQQKEILLKQFNSEEQEEFKDRSISELQLLLEYKAKHLRKGIQRSQPTGASDKRTSTQMTPGSIGSWDPITRTWKPS